MTSPVPVEIMARSWRDIANEGATTEVLQVPVHRATLYYIVLHTVARGCGGWWPLIVGYSLARCGNGVQMSMRTLVAAKRAYPSLLKKDLTTGIEIVLDRASEVNPMTANGQHRSAPLDHSISCTNTTNSNFYALPFESRHCT